MIRSEPCESKWIFSHLHIATATSLFVLLFSAVMGSLTHLTLNNVALVAGTAVAAGALLGAWLGSAGARHVQGRRLVRGLALALILVGLRLIIP